MTTGTLCCCAKAYENDWPACPGKTVLWRWNPWLGEHSLEEPHTSVLVAGSPQLCRWWSTPFGRPEIDHMTSQWEGYVTTTKLFS